MIYERIKQLCKIKGTSVNKLEHELLISRGSLCRIDVNKPSAEKIQKIADYLGVSTTYLMTGEEDRKEVALTSKDERDIQKKLNQIMEDIQNKENSPLYYNGEELDDKSLELLEFALENAMKQMKIINKEKYNPNKK